MLGSLFLRAFCVDRRGAVAIIYALALIPIFGFVGSAIDYARAYTVQSRLQNALDSAVLAAGATPTMSESERIEYAKKVFAANYAAEFGVTATPTITISDDGVINGTVEASLDASILGIIGIDELDVGADAQAKIISKIEGEIVLVLDYSGSMDSRGKYQAMRDAAIKLVETISDDGENEKVKFGLVPFSGEIYVTLPKSYVIGQSGDGDWTNCTADRKYPYNTQDTTPTSDDDTKWGMECSPPSWWPSDWSWTCNPYSMCSNYSSNDLVVRPLSNDFDDIIDQLEDMEPHNLTHIALGLEFGWHLISPNAPFTEAVDYNTEDVLKGIVLLTDGEQTSEGWGPDEEHSVNQAEDNLEDMCEAIKEKGILLMTVAFDLDDESTKERLENCATSPQHYFDADDNSDLASAFDAITSQFVKNLHLSQ